MTTADSSKEPFGVTQQLLPEGADVSQQESSSGNERTGSREAEELLHSHGTEDGDCRSSSEDQLPTSNPERSFRGDHGRNRASFDPSSIRSLCGRHRQQSFVIKFPCCNEYFHCIVCHDLSEPCSRKNLKQFDAQSLKCLDCKKCQRFSDSSQHCVNCGIRFAEYFCRYCKLLTTAVEAEYHCDNCGLCRYLYHKDVTHLDINLLNGHSCRPGFELEPCNVCRKDSPERWEIFPCGHKVHINCAEKRTENGQLCCSICRGPAPL